MAFRIAGRTRHPIAHRNVEPRQVAAQGGRQSSHEGSGLWSVGEAVLGWVIGVGLRGNGVCCIPGSSTGPARQSRVGEPHWATEVSGRLPDEACASGPCRTRRIGGCPLCWTRVSNNQVDYPLPSSPQRVVYRFRIGSHASGSRKASQTSKVGVVNRASIRNGHAGCRTNAKNSRSCQLRTRNRATTDAPCASLNFQNASEPNVRSHALPIDFGILEIKRIGPGHLHAITGVLKDWPQAVVRC